MNISIRPFKVSDAEPFYDAVLESVEHVSQWLPWCSSSYSLQDAIEWADSSISTWEDGSEYRFVIECSDSEEILGSIGINQIVHQHKIGNLGYWVRKSALGQGVCTQAAHQAIVYAFENLSFRRIEIHVHPENEASNAVATRLGGLYEGLFRNKLYFNGESVSAKCYSVIPSDYET